MSVLSISTSPTIAIVFIIVRYYLAGLALPYITENQVNDIMGQGFLVTKHNMIVLKYFTVASE
jgi:hypothetical protein